MIRAILFDLDGVLIDTVDWHYQAFRRALRHFGFDITPEEHDQHYNGLPTQIKLDMLTLQKGLPESLHSRIAQLKQQFTREIIQSECKLDPRMLDLLLTLKQKGYQLGLASNSIRSTIRSVLDRMGLENIFDVVLSAEDVTHPKPDPGIYQSAIKTLEVSPRQCLIIEDSEPGIASAYAANAHVLEVQNPKEVTLTSIQERISLINDSSLPAASENNETKIAC